MAAKGGKRCFRQAGQVYYGEVVSDGSGRCIRQGQGSHVVTATTVTGESVTLGRYTGGWKDDQMSGSGIYRWNDGSAYEGSFLKGKLHGSGTFKWPEGSFYEGSWVDGEMTGQGSFFSAFDGFSVQGIFHRNCLRQHDGSWVDVCRQREQRRAAQLRIAADPSVATALPVSRCLPGNLVAHVRAILQEAPHCVPLILADASCPAGVGAAEAEPASPSPLWCLEDGALGATHETTVYMNYAAGERQRGRDYKEIFRRALREALLTGRIFAVVYGSKARTVGNPQDSSVLLEDEHQAEEAPLPEALSLQHFLDRHSLPADIFDLRHFHSSGQAELFLPDEAKAAAAARGGGPRSDRAPEGDTKPGDEEGQVDAAAPQDQSPAPPPAAGSTLHLLHPAIVSLTARVRADQDEAGIKDHVVRWFSAHVPLQRVSVVVVTGR